MSKKQFEEMDLEALENANGGCHHGNGGNFGGWNGGWHGNWNGGGYNGNNNGFNFSQFFNNPNGAVPPGGNPSGGGGVGV